MFEASPILIQQDSDLREQTQQLVKTLPTRSPIFLPTDKIPLRQQLKGLQTVKRIYSETFKQRYAPRLRELRSQFRGRDRCFVIGNGPSLKKTNLELLKDEITFAVNGFFLKMPELSWAPTFYVVEDHLVAEDRAEQINALRGPTKLFPIYLGYCLEEGPDTIFFNHRPRKSYPHGFDFSTNASEITYAGCTVTFTSLQLAFYFGFKEIYLVGVDASYALPDDVKRQNEYGVGVLDMASDDPNHFDPSYFGKGYRWHDPQVDKMIESYKEALRVTTNSGQNIYNATVGGALEVFPRRDYESLFTERFTSPKSVDHPRLLVIDSTAVGSDTATGQVKNTFLGDWPTERFLQIWQADLSASGFRALRLGQSWQESRKGRPLSAAAALELCQTFSPDAVYVRPVDSLPLMQLAEGALNSLQVPYTIHIMDDWPERLRLNKPADFAVLEGALGRLLAKASVRWSICEKMSIAFAERYGLPFESLANGVDLDQFPAGTSPNVALQSKPCVIRYMGALAKDMTFESVLEIAKAVSDLHDEIKAELHIHTMDWCRKEAEAALAGLDGVRISGLVPWSEYHRTIASSDIVVIAYNFDAKSINYTRFSLANKLPECLASGAPLLAYGPSDVATIEYLKEAGCAWVVDRRDPALLKEQLRRLATDAELRDGLVRKARDFAARKLSKQTVHERFRAGIAKTADSLRGRRPEKILLGPYAREDAVHYDETNAVAAYLNAQTGRGILIDVGAHTGTALAHFLERGWKIWAFEPDQANRAKLESRVTKHRNAKNVTLDTRCVSKASASNLAFYRSEESAGISGLSAFRDSHREAQRVDTVSLRDYFSGQPMPEVDFLKIDTEGHDLFVLQGFPWERNKPKVIECEFEDLKTNPLGYTTKDMADFLVGQGYTVYVSEWHPILRYGQKHDWHRLQKYPCSLASDNAWGNLLAFAQAPEEAALVAAIKHVLTTRKATEESPPSQNATHLPGPITAATPAFQASPHFRTISDGIWRLRRDPHPKTPTLIANFQARETEGVGYVGLATLSSDKPVRIKLILARAGSAPYEGTFTEIEVRPNDMHIVLVQHLFKKPHKNLKLQIEVLDPSTEADLRINNLAVCESVSELFEQTKTNGAVARTANRLFHEGKYMESAMLSALGARELGFASLKFNAQLSLRRMGITQETLTSNFLNQMLEQV
jgi:FkbM family methyltransferase